MNTVYFTKKAVVFFSLRDLFSCTAYTTQYLSKASRINLELVARSN